MMYVSIGVLLNQYLANGKPIPITEMNAVAGNRITRVEQRERQLAMCRDWWKELHDYPLSVAVWDSEEARLWLEDACKRIPTVACDCRTKWNQLVQDNPPDFSSRTKYFWWTFLRHNDVRQLLGQPLFLRHEVEKIYDLRRLCDDDTI